MSSNRLIAARFLIANSHSSRSAQAAGEQIRVKQDGGLLHTLEGGRNREFYISYSALFSGHCSSESIYSGEW
jgi:hypothetical protein